MDELKEMRSQMAQLKQSLSESRIVNCKLLKKVVSQKMSTLNRIVWGEVVAYPILLLMITAFCVAQGISLWFPGTFALASLIDIGIDFKTMRFSSKEIAASTLISIRRKLLKQKKQRRIQNIVMAPLVFIWLICLFIAILRPFELSGTDLTIAWVMAAIVLITTAAVVIWLIRKIDETTDELVTEIDAMEVSE